MDTTNHGLPKPREATDKVLRKLERLVAKHPHRYSVERKEDGLAVSAGRTAEGEPLLFTQKLNLIKHAPDTVAELGKLLASKLGDVVLQAELIDRSSPGERERREDIWSIAGSKAEEARRKIEERGRSPKLMVYDILKDEGVDVRGEPHAARRGRLRKLFDGHQGEHVRLVESTPMVDGDIELHMEHALEGDWEGLVIKDGQAETKTGASREDRPRLDCSWKWKPTRTVDVIVDGWEEGAGKNKGKVGALKCRMIATEDVHERVEVGKVGTGFTERQRREFTEAEFPFVAEVKLQSPYFTRDGQLSCPSFVAVHPDKSVSECVSPRDWPGRSLYQPFSGGENSVSNEKIASMFRRTADLLRIQNAHENEFRIRSYERVAAAVEDLESNVAGMTAGEIEALPGVGKKSAAKIGEFVERGTFSRLEELERTVPDCADLMRLRGVGPVKARHLYQTTGAKTVDDLEKLIDIGRVDDELLLSAVKAVREARGKIRLDEAEVIFSKIRKQVARKMPEVELVLAGSARRRMPLVRDIDLVGVAESPEEQKSLLEFFKTLGGKPEGGDRRAAVTVDGVRVELLMAGPWERGAAIATSTGSGVFNQEVRRIARAEGKLANSEGVFDRESGKKLDDGTESGYFKAAGSKWVPPSVRWGLAGAKVSIRRRDLSRDLHTHTQASGDGSLTLREVVTGAMKRGLKVVAISDHLVGPGFNAASKDEVLRQYSAIDKYNANRDMKDPDLRELVRLEVAEWKAGGRKGPRPKPQPLQPKVLKSGEVEIRGNGTLRGSCGGFVPDEIVEGSDFLLVALHSPPKGCARVGQFEDEVKQAAAREKLTKILERSFSHPKVRVWAHPTGRILGQREGLDFDEDRVLDAMKKHDVALEVNGQPKRMDAEERLVKKAVARGLKISTASDTHKEGGVRHLDNVLAVLQRAGVTKGSLLKPGKRRRRGARGRRGVHKKAIVMA